MEIPQLKSLIDNKSLAYELQLVLSIEVENDFNLNVEISEIDVNKTADSKFGDLTSNIALKIAKAAEKNPREIATLLAESISKNLNKEFVSGFEDKLIYNYLERVEVAGPGFLNFYLKKDIFLKNLREVLSERENYGKWEVANGQVMVEFGQPNTHKAMTAGHIKSGVTGLSSSRLFKNLGYNVIQANYYSDIGLNTAKCTWYFLKKGFPEGFDTWDVDEKMKIVAQGYADAHKEYKENLEAAEEIKQINKKIYDKSDEEVLKMYLKLKEISIEQQDKVFAKLGIVFDRQYPESECAESGVNLVKQNLGKVFIEDQGAIIFPGEKYGLVRWVFLNSMGLPTYSGKDLGLGYKKFEEYPELVFNLTMTSTEQNSYFDAIIKALELIDERFVNHYFFRGFGWLLRDGKKMNSKSGNAVTVDGIFNDAYEFAINKISENKGYTAEEAKEIAEKVVMAGLKFLFLSREFHIDINYDPKQFMNPEGFSGPYVLYAYVRAKSILREVANYELNVENYELNEDELSLLKLISQFPLVTLNAGKTLSPHLIANYIFELAQAFNKFYKNNKVLVDEANVKNFRLALTEAVSIVLANGMYLLGIDTVEKM